MDVPFCIRLPKIELHAHLNGSLTLKTLRELYMIHEQNKSEQITGWDCPDFAKDCWSLNSFFTLIQRTYAMTSTPESVCLATQRVIEDFAEDNVVYLELRSNLRKEKDMTKTQYLDAVIKGILHCQETIPVITVKFIVSVSRNETVEDAEENVKLAIEYLAKYPKIIAGIDVSGDPGKNNFSDYVQMLNRAKAEGLKVTVHCAEVEGKEEARVILEYHPDRIGHGTCIHESYGGDPTLWKLLLEKQIPVELCLTSNIKCRTVDSFENHPFRLLYAAEHPVTLSTDDKGAFGITLSEEYEIVKQTFKLSEEALWKLNFRNVDFIFGDENEKESLRTMLTEWKTSNL